MYIYIYRHCFEFQYSRFKRCRFEEKIPFTVSKRKTIFSSKRQLSKTTALKFSKTITFKNDCFEKFRKFKMSFKKITESVHL